MEMVLDKNKFRQFSYLSSKWVLNQQRQLNNTFGPGTANKRTVQSWFKKFCNGNKRLEDVEPSGRPLEVDSNQWEPSPKLILLQLHKKLAMPPFYGHLASEANWEGDKAL